MIAGRDAERSITLHSSWRGITLSVLGAIAVLAVGVLAVASNGWRVLSTGLVVIGVVLFVGVLVLILFGFFVFLFPGRVTRIGYAALGAFLFAAYIVSLHIIISSSTRVRVSKGSR